MYTQQHTDGDNQWWCRRRRFAAAVTAALAMVYLSEKYIRRQIAANATYLKGAAHFGVISEEAKSVTLADSLMLLFSTLSTLRLGRKLTQPRAMAAKMQRWARLEYGTGPRLSSTTTYRASPSFACTNPFRLQALGCTIRPPPSPNGIRPLCKCLDHLSTLAHPDVPGRKT